MRITGGSLKNLKILPPKNALRPTTDKVRSALFSTLGGVEGAVFFDLFAGTGAVGIEALSRGAKSAAFLDIDASSLEKNLRSLPTDFKYKVIKSDFFQAKKKLEGYIFDIVYIDPPYGAFPADKVLIQLKAYLSDNAVIVYEQSSKTAFAAPTDFSIVKQRVYGDTILRYIRLSNPHSA
ncbi:MAG: 16S rRNA (guanine(966)-N(2))-methyltransferase RsmD [Deferribacteraceae bacterium]|jgi:16S rRNA (guanine966-N2)-methyltransferase|nr:16S rRNA (guanine(966)-N(2))-methyltransferase RsmD [Deferribacteraceae bacterium]